jgi:hypothetical protein
MPMWVWIAVGLALWLALSVLLAFALARVLGMSRRISVYFGSGPQISKYEAEYWATLPPTRATKEVAEEHLPMKSFRIEHVQQARDAVNTLRSEVEAGNLSSADIERVRQALRLLSAEAERLDREIALLEPEIPSARPRRR